MDLKALTDLISVRKYLQESINNLAIDRSSLNYIINLLSVVDNKIIQILKSDSFKKYVEYDKNNEY